MLPHVISLNTTVVNPLNAELNPVCHLLALLGAHHTLHVSGIRVNKNNYFSCVGPIILMLFEL